MKFIITAFILSLSFSFAQADTDLVLETELWLGGFTKYTCENSTDEVVRPESFEQMNLVFESMTTDASLDNVLMKATYEENGSSCRYSALLFADNALWTIDLLESKAYAVEGDSDCSAGKQVIDAALAANKYTYGKGRVVINAPVAGAKDLCGSGTIGINWANKGMIQK